MSLWVAWAAASFIVALAGPFGTFGALPFGWRLTYWGLLIAVAILIGIVIQSFWRNRLVDRSEWYEDFVVSASLSILFSPMVFLLNHSFLVPHSHHAFGLLATIGVIFAIAMSMSVLRRVLRVPVVVAPSLIRNPADPRRDRLLGRIPASLEARLVRISSDNHHIRIRTDDGAEHRILMRLRDAADEIDVERGFLVHRSHWVARSVIAGVTHKGQREMVELTCGALVPIGPKYRANLVKANIITD